MNTLVSGSNLKQHWFWPVAFAVCVVNAATIMLDGWQAPQLKEFGVLFDFAILIPVLYLICYRSQGKNALVRALAFACLGIWAAGHIVPDIHHALIERVSPLRYLGLAVLFLITIRFAIEIRRLTFQSDRDKVRESVRQRAEQEGVPAWVAKLMAWEAQFWRKAWSMLRGLFRR